MASSLSSEEGKFQTRDGLNLYFRLFLNPHAENTLVIHHGHGEHSGRYAKFAAHLADKKLNIATFDARGHGLSEGKHVYVESYEDYLQDTGAFISFLDTTFKLNKKFLLLGHSNGGLVAAHWALRNPDRLQALFLSSPFLGLRLPGFLVALNDFLNRCNPSFVYRNPVYPPYLTHNLEEVENYKKDPLIRRRISVRLLHQMMTYQHRLEQAHSFEFPFPVYILMAGLERVVDPRKTHSFFEKLHVPDKELKVFPGFYHEIFNELGQEQVFDVLRRFIDRSQSKNSAEVRS